MREGIAIIIMAIGIGLALGLSNASMGASVGVSKEQLRENGIREAPPPSPSKTVWFLTTTQPVGVDASRRRFLSHYSDVASCESVKSRSQFEPEVTAECTEVQVKSD